MYKIAFLLLFFGCLNLANGQVNQLEKKPTSKNGKLIRPGYSARFSEIDKRINEIASGMILVKGGTFNMSTIDDTTLKKQLHTILLPDYYIGKFEVTQAQWRAVMGGNPSYFNQCDSCPVEQITYDNANAFCKRLSRKTGKVYRLPTEAEWVFAARGGNNTKRFVYSGSNNIDSVGWYIGNSNRMTHAGGQKLPNELGIFDMTGNVWEWCSDWYDIYKLDSSGRKGEPKKGSYLIYCGGGWDDHPQASLFPSRISYLPAYRCGDVGFRLVRSN